MNRNRKEEIDNLLKSLDYKYFKSEYLFSDTPNQNELYFSRSQALWFISLDHKQILSLPFWCFEMPVKIV